MIFIYLFITALAVNSAFSTENTEHDHSKMNTEKAFKDNQIAPDLIAVPPAKLLEVSYPKSSKEVMLGNELTPTEVREAPKITFDGDSKSFYTLMLVDPDAPSRKNPIRRAWQHWLVVNIPGSDVAKGESVADYVGSGPPKGTDLHRYVFLLYKQPEKVKFNETRHTNTDGNRGQFMADKFAKTYGLGNPIAGNFFVAKYDESVPSLHKQLGF